MPSANYRMADRLTGGHLAQILRDFDANGMNADAISRQLFADYGVEVSRPTVALWVAEVRSGELDGAA